jgi:hypothetical protein
MTQDNGSESERGHSLALAAALAMLGVSVGVNVQDLLAASPAETVESGQSKIRQEGFKKDAAQIKKESAQQKFDALQHKLPSVQDKERIRPGVKPIDPPRQ